MVDPRRGEAGHLDALHSRCLNPPGASNIPSALWGGGWAELPLDHEEEALRSWCGRPSL